MPAGPSQLTPEVSGAWGEAGGQAGAGGHAGVLRMWGSRLCMSSPGSVRPPGHQQIESSASSAWLWGWRTAKNFLVTLWIQSFGSRQNWASICIWFQSIVNLSFFWMVSVGCGWMGGWLLGCVFHEKDAGGIKRENKIWTIPAPKNSRLIGN